MKAYIFLAVIFVTICTSWAGIMNGIAENNKDYPNQCYIGYLKQAYPVGEHTVKGKCQQVVCHEDFLFQIHTCGKTVVTEPGYHNEVDLTKPYPQCCTHLVKNKN